jgi:hypothetical protein
MSAPIKDNNMMWLALAIGGGVLAYSFLRKDIVAVADTAVDTVKKVADLANPISQGNILNTAINKTGQAITQNPNWTGGGAIFDLTDKTNPQKGVKYVPLPAQKINGLWKKQINGQWVTISNDEKVVTVKGKLVVWVDQYDLIESNTNGANKTKFVQLPAREVNGKWQKQVNGQWLPLGTKDTVTTVKGRYVVLMEQAA